MHSVTYRQIPSILVLPQTGMTNLVAQTQNYFTTINNKIRDLNLQYNNAVRQQFSFNRRYTTGEMLVSVGGGDVPLFGKPATFEKDVNDVFSNFISDINNDTEGYITYLNQEVGFFSNKTIRAIKNNYKDYINNFRGTFQNAATSILQSIVDAETSYIQSLSRANVLLYNDTNPNLGTDGYQRTDGNAVVIDISGTTAVSASSVGVTNTLQELDADLNVIVSALTAFETAIESNYTANISGKSYTGFLVTNSGGEATVKADVFEPFTDDDFWNSETNPESNRRQYFILSQQIIDENRYNSFKNSIIGNLRDNTAVLGNVTFQQVEATFDNYWKGVARPAYQLENAATDAFLSDFQVNVLRNYLNFTPFNLNKERVFTYETLLQPVPDQVLLIKSLGNKNNIDTNVSSWTTTLGNVIIGKAQLL